VAEEIHENATGPFARPWPVSSFAHVPSLGSRISAGVAVELVVVRVKSRMVVEAEAGVIE
jgi:hypothetical protein